MKRTSRLLASVKPARYLESGAPTGLTGLFTHPTPRSALIYFYSKTLDKLKQIPDSSAYRQSTEALTNHRLKIIRSVVPPGYEAWQERAKTILSENKDVLTTSEGRVAHGSRIHVERARDGATFVITKAGRPVEDTNLEWDGEEDTGGELEGMREIVEGEGQAELGGDWPSGGRKAIEWPDEPQLTADQISEVENQIGAGLIEEVIQVAEAEFKLVDVMTKAKVWEDLEEKPAEGQWTYFER